MLVDSIEQDSLALCDPMLALVAAINGLDNTITRLGQGFWQAPSFNGDHYITLAEVTERYPKFYVEGVTGPVGDSMEELVHLVDWDKNCYGVCDDPQQVLNLIPELTTSDRQFTVTFCEVRKADQSPEGGWRWHKWGPYIGKHEPKYEYLYDEEGIDRVFCYHIYEVRM